MEIKPLDFLLGLILGGILGVGLTLAVIKLRSWLGRSETSRLQAENRALKRRLAEKLGGEKEKSSPPSHQDTERH